MSYDIPLNNSIDYDYNNNCYISIIKDNDITSLENVNISISDEIILNNANNCNPNCYCYMQSLENHAYMSKISDHTYCSISEKENNNPLNFDIDNLQLYELTCKINLNNINLNELVTGFEKFYLSMPILQNKLKEINTLKIILDNLDYGHLLYIWKFIKFIINNRNTSFILELDNSIVDDPFNRPDTPIIKLGNKYIKKIINNDMIKCVSLSDYRFLTIDFTNSLTIEELDKIAYFQACKLFSQSKIVKYMCPSHWHQIYRNQ